MEETNKTGSELVKRDENGRVVSGVLNPNGRPKGRSMKEFWKQRFAAMSDEEIIAWIEEKKVPGDVIWRMAEGQPKQSMDGGEDDNGNPIPILGGLSVANVRTNNSPQEDSKPE